MIGFRLASLLAGALCCLSGAPAVAADSRESAESTESAADAQAEKKSAETDPLQEERKIRGYLGVGGLWALEDLQGNLEAKGDGSAGVYLRAGLRATDWVAIELGFEWIDGFDIEGPGGDVDGYSVTLNSRWFPLSGRVQPFALIGIGWGEFDVKLHGPFEERSAFVARFGGGMEVWLSDHVGLMFDASYLLGTDDLDDVRYASFGGGLLCRF